MTMTMIRMLPKVLTGGVHVVWVLNYKEVIAKSGTTAQGV
jgi:hypothetical protein